MDLSISININQQLSSSDAIVTPLNWWETGDFAGEDMTNPETRLLQFADNRYMQGGGDILLADIGYTSEHPTEILVKNLDGTYDTIPPDVIPRNARGMWVSPDVLNSFMSSNDVLSSAWASSTVVNTGTTTTAPDGSQSSVCTIGVGYVYQDITVAVNEQRTISFYIKANKNATISVRDFRLGHNTNIPINVTTEWTRIVLSGVAPLVASRLLIDNRNRTDAGTSSVGGLEISVWGVLGEAGLVPSSPINTGTSPVIRHGNKEVIAGLNIPDGFEAYAIFNKISERGNFNRVFEVNNNSDLDRCILYEDGPDLKMLVSANNVVSPITTVDAIPVLDVITKSVMTVGGTYVRAGMDNSVSNSIVSYPILSQVNIGSRSTTRDRNIRALYKEFFIRPIANPNDTSYTSIEDLAEKRRIHYSL